MKPAGVFLTTYLSVTQFETRHRLVEAELEREHAKAAGRSVVEPPRRRRWFRAVRGAAAAWAAAPQTAVRSRARASL